MVALFRVLEKIPNEFILKALAAPTVQTPESVVAELLRVDVFDDALGRGVPRQRVESLRSLCSAADE